MEYRPTCSAPAALKQFVVLVCSWGACAEDARPSEQQGQRDAAEERQGSFVGSVVSGLRYATPMESGTTDADGKFFYRSGDTVTFSVGDLMLGSTTGRPTVTAVDLVPGASDASNDRVTNILALLQTLDEDADLNNGIQITEGIARIASAYEARIDFDQPANDFAADDDVVSLFDESHTAHLFTGADPRKRVLRSPTAAREHFVRATSKRKIVSTQQGDVSGYAANESTWQWLGIRYAKPPLGSLRWKPPQEPETWVKTRDAVAWGDQAPQDPALAATGQGGVSEDCLHLNVTAPEGAKDLPVMVWFHGGAFTILTANSKAYNNPNSLTTKGVVVVTVNHRLGPFGYLAHPLLVADSTYGGSGNYGQMDLVMALQWVRNNIAEFGGDANNVTIFGQSGGCAKTAMLMASPMATGLFQQAICQSGNRPIVPNTKEQAIATAEGVGKSLFDRLGITSIEQARELPWDAIIQSDIDAMTPREVYLPNVDNYYLSKTYYEIVREGQPNDVPLMLGSTSGDYPALRTSLIDVARFRSEYSRSNLYVYKFSRVPAGWAEQGVLSGHAGELPYLFNYPPMFVNNYLFNLVLDPRTNARFEIGDLNGDGVTGTAGDAADILTSQGWNDDDAYFANAMMTVWTNFAKTGVPSAPELDWPPFEADSDRYVEFGPTRIEVKTGLAAAFPE
jgi:para-nitrobenzyl esterase